MSDLMRRELCGIDKWAMKKNLVVYGYIGDDMLPRYIGIIINHYKDP